jgi:diacylglycerol kinase family enzyme
MVEVLNTRATGSRLKLAPDADPGDGLLDVVCIREDDCDNLLRYAKAVLDEKLDELPSVESYRGRQPQLVWDGFPVHLDAKVPSHPSEENPRHEHSEGGVVTINILPNALDVWLPEDLLTPTR